MEIKKHTILREKRGRWGSYWVVDKLEIWKGVEGVLLFGCRFKVRKGSSFGPRRYITRLKNQQLSSPYLYQVYGYWNEDGSVTRYGGA